MPSVLKPVRIRSPAHMIWVRSLPCSVLGCGSHGECDPAHVRRGTDGGTSLKPSDCWVLPLCHPHHVEQHQVGEQSFARKYRLDMKAEAAKVWARSPHRPAAE